MKDKSYFFVGHDNSSESDFLDKDLLMQNVSDKHKGYTHTNPLSTDDILRTYYKQIEQEAKIIYSTIYPGYLECDSMFAYAKRYEEGIIGNVDIYKCVQAAIRLFGERTLSEMSDMMQEFEGLGLVVIEV